MFFNRENLDEIQEEPELSLAESDHADFRYDLWREDQAERGTWPEGRDLWLARAARLRAQEAHAQNPAGGSRLHLPSRAPG